MAGEAEPRFELESWVSDKRDRQFVLASGATELRACVSRHPDHTELSVSCWDAAAGAPDPPTLVAFMRAFVQVWPRTGPT